MEDGRPSIAQDISNILERIPNTAVSAAPSSTLSDHELREFLYKSKDSATGWRALAEHALSERDVGGSESRSLSPFPPIDTDDRHEHTANRHRHSHRVKAYDESAHTDLIGTPLADAANTSVGSIMPKFKFTELY